MRIMLAAALGFAPAAAFAHDPEPPNANTALTPPGLTNVMREPLVIDDGLEVIITDIQMGPGATLPRHYHPGEEFIYVLEGSATHRQDGQEDILLEAGDSYHIPPEAVHAPVTLDEGMRAVVFRVHVKGEPERFLVDGNGEPVEEDPGED